MVRINAISNATPSASTAFSWGVCLLCIIPARDSNLAPTGTSKELSTDKDIAVATVNTLGGNDRVERGGTAVGKLPSSRPTPIVSRARRIVTIFARTCVITRARMCIVYNDELGYETWYFFLAST